MSHDLVISIVAVALNLSGMMVIYLLLSHAFARGGILTVVVLIVLSQFFWMVASFWLIDIPGVGLSGAYALWLGDWLVTGFSIVVLWKSAASIPLALRDAARLDGLGSFTTWRHTVLPFVRRDLVILAAFTVMATIVPFWAVINIPDAEYVSLIFHRFFGLGEAFKNMIAGSLIGAASLIALFFLANRRCSLERRALSRPN
jgi:ABC-type glycerol-3-phosphate transport system permease component